MIALIRRYYGLDALHLTYGRFISLLNQIPKIKLWESGKDPHEKDNPKNLSPEEFIERVKRGDLSPDALKPDFSNKRLSQMSDAERMAEERRVLEMIGLQGKEVQIPPHQAAAANNTIHGQVPAMPRVAGT